MVQTIGQYQIIEPLGQGGMAKVYKAYHPRLNRYVAIKMIYKGHLEDPGFVARFEREAQIVAALEHPNIIPVFDFAEHEGQPYIVMKLVEGCTLKSILNNGPVQLEDILKVLPPLADALDYAHQQGVLHRDIKPSNVIIDMKNTPYLTDFGLARLAMAGESTYSQDMLLGTPYYISPEQAMGDRELDNRADLYSFGVVLYELLVGQVPYSSGTPLSIIHDHIYRPLPLPSLINPEIPPQVEAVLLKALAKEADDRYQTAKEILAALSESIRSAKLTALNPERRHTIAETLARVRVEREEASQRTYKSSVTPNGAVGLPREAPAQSKHTRRKSSLAAIIGVIAIFMLVLLVGFALIRGARQNNTPSPAIELYQVPVLTLEQAQNAIEQNPDDPASYLALARASAPTGDIRILMATLMEGARHTDDPVRYWLTVGTGAIESGHLTIGFAAYRDALVRAASGENYPEVRAFVGERLYNAAELPGALELRGLQRWYEQEADTLPPLLQVLYARVLFVSGRPAQIGSEVNRILESSADIAETHLVRGDIFSATGRRDQALDAWEAARSQPDAPQWVRDRATELIESS